MAHQAHTVTLYVPKPVEATDVLQTLTDTFRAYGKRLEGQLKLADGRSLDKVTGKIEAAGELAEILIDKLNKLMNA